VKIAFLSLEASEPLAYGLMVLSASLRAHGHACALVQARNVEAVIADPTTANADVLALSATTGLHRVYLAWAKALRGRFPDKIIVLGGPHATFYPRAIELAPLDGVCIGEGEESFPEFLQLAQQGFPSIPDGWWIRRDRGQGPVECGAARPPVRDLNALPSPAFDLFYDADPRYRKEPNKSFLATRGCPFRCSYCFNSQLNQRYRAYGPLLRSRDPERLCDDILSVRDRWGLKLVWFLDANFISNLPWLEAFVAVYRRRVGLPMFCKLRPERATNRILGLLDSAGCTGVGVGIESGSERVRREILCRPASDADILAGCRRLKARGIRIMSFSMLGIPGATLEDELRTVALNVACGIDLAAATILQPYPGTAIAEWAESRGFFDGNYDRLGYSYFDESPFRYPSKRDRDRVTNLQRLFSYAVEFPEVRKNIRWLIDREPNRLYTYLFKQRQTRGIRGAFYRAFRRDRPVDSGRPEQLLRACRDLKISEPRYTPRTEVPT
jgi:anaerobic magnesium-protoporphyrin IX monomethyl ester cyclase